MAFLNAAFYVFAPIDDPDALASRLKTEVSSLGVLGTLILAPEGLNGFLAGPEEKVRACLALLKSEPAFASLKAKESVSSAIPFTKLFIKVKDEIVTFRVPGFDSLRAHAPSISPAELCRWYEEGEDFLVLDTRNEYEFRIGAFENAVSLGLKQFVEFPAAVRALPPEWKGKKILTYCTGGIRCEKAAPYLRSLGYDAYQLEGGILNHFEKAGKSHWRGECFVFDERVALDASLAPTGAALCPRCQGPVPAREATCPHCGV